MQKVGGQNLLSSVSCACVGTTSTQRCNDSSSSLFWSTVLTPRVTSTPRKRQLQSTHLRPGRESWRRTAGTQAEQVRPKTCRTCVSLIKSCTDLRRCLLTGKACDQYLSQPFFSSSSKHGCHGNKNPLTSHKLHTPSFNLCVTNVYFSFVAMHVNIS